MLSLSFTLQVIDLFPVLCETQAELGKMLAGVWGRAAGSEQPLEFGAPTARSLEAPPETALGTGPITVASVDSSLTGDPTTWISWPGKRGRGKGCVPLAFHHEWRGRRGPPSPSTMARWRGPQALSFQKVGQGSGAHKELKIKPVCLCSLGGSLGGRWG